MSTLRAAFLTLFLLLIALSITPTTHANKITPDKTVQMLGESSLAFVPNVGQFAGAYLFQARAPRGTLAFARDHVALTIPLTREAEQDAREYAALALRFENANAAPEIARGKMQRGVVNYLRGNDPTQWRGNVPTYESITYKNLYAGIDLEYDGAAGLLKGNYFVAAGADPKMIRWRYEGAAGVRAANDGALHITLPQTREKEDGRVYPAFELIEAAPLAWQVVNGARQMVDVKFVVRADETIGFALGAYDSQRALTIDPEFSYAQLLRGNGKDYAYSIAVDGAGNAYITGMTTSIDFATTEGAWDQAFDKGMDYAHATACEDAFVVKLAADGALIYSTFLGGTQEDRAKDIAVDEKGRAYVIGSTFSGDFPLMHPYQFTMNHSALEYSTYYGGSGLDIGTSVAVDSEGFAYVGGYTTSFDLPLVNAFQTTHRSCQCASGYPNAPFFEGNTDGFVARFDPQRVGVESLRFASYYGGGGEDFLREIAIDITGAIFAVGNSDSTDLTMLNAYDGNCAIGDEGWCVDAFVLKVDTNANQLRYATYLGGDEAEGGHGVALADSSGDVYVAGHTGSHDFPLLSPYDNSLGGLNDAFYAKLDTDVLAARLRFCTRRISAANTLTLRTVSR